MKKKLAFLALLLCVIVICAGIFTACDLNKSSNNDSTSQKRTITNVIKNSGRQVNGEYRYDLGYFVYSNRYIDSISFDVTMEWTPEIEDVFVIKALSNDVLLRTFVYLNEGTIGLTSSIPDKAVKFVAQVPAFRYASSDYYDEWDVRVADFDTSAPISQFLAEYSTYGPSVFDGLFYWVNQNLSSYYFDENLSSLGFSLKSSSSGGDSQGGGQQTTTCDHSYRTTVVAPTCTEDGYTEHTCSRCGDSYRDNTTSATGVHSYEAGNVTIGDCPLSSYQTYTCSNCGSAKQEFVSSGSTISTCHHDLEVGDTCEHCGHSVYSKSNDTVIMSLGENKLSVEYYGTGATQINSSLEQYVANVFFANSVTSIEVFAFYNCSGLTSVTIPDSVTSIGYSAFQGCSGLTSVTMKDELYAYIGSFGGTPWYNSLETEEVNGVSYRGKVAMDSSYSGLPPTYIRIKEDTIAIARDAFSNEDFLTSVTIGNGVTSIGSYAFESCTGLTSIIIPDSVTSIGYMAFRGCTGLTSVTIPNSVTSIDDYAFYDCSGLTSIYYAGDIASWCAISGRGRLMTSFGTSNKKLYINGEEVSCDLVIPNGVISIGYNAFSGCTGLTSVTIPNSVTSIGSCAFYSCTGLTSITFNGTKAQWNAISKGTDWNYNTGKYTIHCTDGDIKK